MSVLDWLVLGATILAIVLYGLWTARRIRDLSHYMRGDDLPWATIGLSVMATQASAITFLSTPGQGYEKGMAFLQNYLGLPLAMIVIAVFFLPIYQKLNIYTAYEYLGRRFDRKTRLLGALLFLVQRGLAASITIYAPAIILSTILGWPLQPTIVVTGGLVIAYTMTGGATTVGLTQKYQMLVILLGMASAFACLLASFPENVDWGDALAVAGAHGRLEAIDWSLDPNRRYTVWSGLLGGFFLALSYFGTDQSQVQRYIGAHGLTASRRGLLLNGALKIPMQFGILLLGALLFSHYQFVQPPMLFHQAVPATLENEVGLGLEKEFNQVFAEKRVWLEQWAVSQDETFREEAMEQVRTLESRLQAIRGEWKNELRRIAPETEVEDADYVFLHFALANLPSGLLGLLIAVILCASMSSTASELNALASTSMLDLYRMLDPQAEENRLLFLSRLATLGWGVISIVFAMYLTLFENLIEAINIIGSLFYGTILGLFLAGFFLRRIGANAIFCGALCGEALVLVLYWTCEIGYLWFNLIGCTGTLLAAAAWQRLFFHGERTTAVHG